MRDCSGGGCKWYDGSTLERLWRSASGQVGNVKYRRCILKDHLAVF